MKKYSFIDHPEHEGLLKQYADKWTANALSTKPMDEHEKELCRQAVINMYKVAKLTTPKNIVFVPSPFVLVFASGLSNAILRNRRDKLDYNTARDTTIDATLDAPYRTATRDLTSWCVVDNCLHELDKQVTLNGEGIRQTEDCHSNALQGGNQWSAWCGLHDFFKSVAKLADYGIDYTNYSHWETLA